MKEADSEKEAAMEAELKAARERAIVPLEKRMTQFRDMLLKRGVKHFNPTQYCNQLCNVRHIDLNGSPPRYTLQLILLFLVFGALFYSCSSPSCLCLLSYAQLNVKYLSAYVLLC